MVAKGVTSLQIKGALAKRHEGKEFFLAECKNGPTHAPDAEGMVMFDAVAIDKSWSRPRIVGYEIKTSRGDFLRDAKYTRYLPYVHEFYFVTPAGMVQRHEVEESIGLMWYNPKSGGVTTKKKAVYRKIEINANMLLYIIMSRLEGDRYPFHSTQAEYWRDWLTHKISSRELGWQVRCAVAGRLLRLESEVSEHKHSTHVLKEIRGVMERHGLSWWGDTAATLDRALAKAYPASLDTMRKRLEEGVQSMQNMLKELDVIKARGALTDGGGTLEGTLYPLGEEG